MLNQNNNGQYTLDLIFKLDKRIVEAITGFVILDYVYDRPYQHSILTTACQSCLLGEQSQNG